MLGGKRLRFTDAQRRRLALKARLLSHATLRELGSLVTPDTLTRWFRKYAGAKYDSHAKRGPGRPPKPQHIRDLSGRLIAATTDHRGRGSLARRQRLGGLLNHYCREAV